MLALRRKVLGPEHPDTLLAMNNLASSYHDAGRRDEALKLREEWVALAALVVNGAENLSNEDSLAAMMNAGLLVWFGKDDEHTALSKRLLGQAAGTGIVGVAERIAKISCLRPNADTTMQAAALTLARRGVELGNGNKKFSPWYQLALGMAEYRNGHFAEATDTLAAIPGASVEATWKRALAENTAGFYCAMSLVREGKAEEAHALFTAIEAKMNPLPTDRQNPLVDKGAGIDDLILWLAYEEAKQVLESVGDPGTAE